jgi:predicted ATPase
MFLAKAELKRDSLGTRTGYPFSIPAIHHLNSLPFPTAVTFFVGENGSGKSTLLEALAAGCGLNPEGGPKHIRFSTRASHSPLYKELRLTKIRPAPTDQYFLRAESFYNLATAIENPSVAGSYDLESFGGRSLHAQSHGESFMALVLHRLRGNGLYFFDEPEAALSPSRQLTLLAAIQQLVIRRSQFIVATHSPILLGFPGATIYAFGAEAIHQVEFTETEHYQITKAFLDHPARMLRELFRSDPEPTTSDGEG